MIAVIIPAHNEAECMAACLASVFLAASHPELHEAVEVIVAVDRCTDATAELALALGAHVIDVPVPGGVGIARPPRLKGHCTGRRLAGRDRR